MLTETQKDLVEQRLPFVCKLVTNYNLNDDGYSALCVKLCELVLKGIPSWKISLYTLAKSLRDEVSVEILCEEPAGHYCYDVDFKSISIMTDLCKVLDNEEIAVVNLLMRGFNLNKTSTLLNITTDYCTKIRNRVSCKLSNYTTFDFVSFGHFI